MQYMRQEGMQEEIPVAVKSMDFFMHHGTGKSSKERY